MIAICESWLTSAIPNSFIDIHGFDFICKDSPDNTANHGVGIYVSKCIRFKEIDIVPSNAYCH